MAGSCSAWRRSPSTTWDDSWGLDRPPAPCLLVSLSPCSLLLVVCLINPFHLHAYVPPPELLAFGSIRSSIASGQLTSPFPVRLPRTPGIQSGGPGVVSPPRGIGAGLVPPESAALRRQRGAPLARPGTAERIAGPSCPLLRRGGRPGHGVEPPGSLRKHALAAWARPRSRRDGAGGVGPDRLCLARLASEAALRAAPLGRRTGPFPGAWRCDDPGLAAIRASGRATLCVAPVLNKRPCLCLVCSRAERGGGQARGPGHSRGTGST